MSHPYGIKNDSKKKAVEIGDVVHIQYFGNIFWMSLRAKRGNLVERNCIITEMKISFL